ncbi:HK97 family phage prohead protease [Stenotrophomonas forensis]|uniref:HK97 family phage prohead protease n=1 Tax=Stenotrophomonas forensis TaxID=2871169 RepID=A0ABY7Y5U9_9GAMM|nr:HK97 family phage prohead protease [Stenotrophomonas sp. DFS-20110405]WDM65321.1 HK97 family phage prohead protease [Stenotrophomonas sp. DFS-20110405]
MLSNLACPFEVKSADESGNFVGYASVFDNVDLGGDLIVPGAFVKVKTNRNGRLRLALYHNLTRLVGNSAFEQDSKGLLLSGKVNLNVSYARDAYELMRDGTLDEMSIGFNTLEDAIETRGGKQVRVIKKAELWEASFVPFGMNPEAQVMSVKSDVRTFESALRERMGLSQKEAAAVASLGFPAIHRDGGIGDTETVKQLQQLGTSIESIFKGMHQ